jgi:deoxyribodipyrimidine photolyase
MIGSLEQLSSSLAGLGIPLQYLELDKFQVTR